MLGFLGASALRAILMVVMIVLCPSICRFMHHVSGASTVTRDCVCSMAGPRYQGLGLCHVWW